MLDLSMSPVAVLLLVVAAHCDVFHGNSRGFDQGLVLGSDIRQLLQEDSDYINYTNTTHHHSKMEINYHSTIAEFLRHLPR